VSELSYISRESGLLDAAPLGALHGIDPAEIDITGGQQYALLVDYLAQQTYSPEGLPVPARRSP
jgi:hypothetical protein